MLIRPAVYEAASRNFVDPSLRYAVMNFAIRPPSTAWELVPLIGDPPCLLWAWFKPPGAPLNVMVQIPPETRVACAGSLSLRRLVQSLGIPVEAVDSWTLNGVTYLTQGGTNPLVDQPLPPPPPQGDVPVIVQMSPVTPPVHLAPMPLLHPPAASMPSAAMPSSFQPADAHSSALLEGFHTDWQSLLQLETLLASARKQLGAIQGQLQSLNRDLTPDERLVADNQDKKDWQDARRWLRDSLALVSRYIRDHDIGMVSAAGNRNRFERIYNEHIVPRQPFAGLAAACLEFEQHRKTAQNLLVQMQSAHQNASRDGVNRASQLLNRIGAKVRKAKEKRGTR